MTVSDLIKELQKMDQNKEIWADSVEGGMAKPLTCNPFYYSNIQTYTGYYPSGQSYTYDEVDEEFGQPVIVIQVP